MQSTGHAWRSEQQDGSPGKEATYVQKQRSHLPCKDDIMNDHSPRVFKSVKVALSFVLKTGCDRKGLHMNSLMTWCGLMKVVLNKMMLMRMEEHLYMDDLPEVLLIQEFGNLL
nr:uncharacterized protein LOC117859355 [Setaria viridis]